MLSAKLLESRDLSPIAKLQCERGLTSLDRFLGSAKTMVNMTSKLLLLASRKLERKKERKKRLEIAGCWLYSSRGSRLVDRLSHFDLRRRKTVSGCELPV